MTTGRIVERIGTRDGDLLLVCPHFAGLTAAEADLVGCLPIGDANGALLAIAGTFPADPQVYACILAADPFRPAPVLLSALKAAGVGAVVNLPTVAAITDGLAEALRHAGVDYGTELATLKQAVDLGMEVMAVATNADQARQAMAAGLGRLLIYPVADADPAGRGRRATAAREAIATARAQRPAPEVLVFRHPDYGKLAEPLVAAADGVVAWAIAPRPAGGTG